jgi:hypothetical protein
MVATSTSGKPRARWAAGFAYAAGATGLLANLFLIAMYVLLGLQGGSPAGGTLLGSAFYVTGSANDLVGSLSTAFTIPLALALAASLPDRRLAWISCLIGLPAMTVLVVGGPLLVLGVLSFEVQTPCL